MNLMCCQETLVKKYTVMAFSSEGIFMFSSELVIDLFFHLEIVHLKYYIKKVELSPKSHSSEDG